MSGPKNKRTLILLGLTIAASIYLVVDLFFLGKAPRSSRKASDRPAAARAVDGPTVPKPPAVPAATPTRRLAPPPPPDQLWGRDPFAIDPKRLPRGPKAADQFSGFKITGVVWGPQGYQALVNDRVVRVGDQVDGARILRITKEGVELSKDGETHFLPLSEKGLLR
jgi:hypothetical protein